MLREGKIWLARSTGGEDLFLLPQKACRHGVLAGMNNYEVTLGAQVLAEGFSDLGIPVFMLDDSNRLAGMLNPRKDSGQLGDKSAFFDLEESGFTCQGYPVTFWDIYGQTGIPLRASMMKMGPQIISHILSLNKTQSQLLKIIFHIAHDQGLRINDIRDLKAMINYYQSHIENYRYEYGLIDKFSLEELFRSVISLESKGLGRFFYEPALDIIDLLQTDSSGKGMINILDSHSLVFDSHLYSGILLWLLIEASKCMPAIDMPEQPRMVFIIDEAQLLFKNISLPLLEKVVHHIRKLESKGISVFFCTQNMTDLPEMVLNQLENKIHFAPQAYTPSAQKATRSAAMYFRKNPSFDTYKTLLNLGSGTVLISLIEKSGVPSVVEKAHILPTQSEGGQISYAERDKCIRNSTIYSKYSHVHDFESAYEFIERRKIEEAKQIEKHLFGTVESTAFGKQYSSNTDKGTTSTSYSHFNMVGDAEPISKRKKSSGGFFRNLFKK